MSTIRHPLQNHTWWYVAAAAAVLTGLLAVLIATVFLGSGSAGSSGDDPGRQGIQTLENLHAKAYGAPCFAGHPSASIELVRSGCASAAR